MTPTQPSARALKGLSILVIDDDRLSAYRLHRALVAQGARVASGDLAAAEPYLGAAALAAVVVGTGLNTPDTHRLVSLLLACRAPWIAYGPARADGLLAKAAAHVATDIDRLVAQLAAMCTPARH